MAFRKTGDTVPLGTVDLTSQDAQGESKTTAAPAPIKLSAEDEAEAREVLARLHETLKTNRK